MAEFHGAGVAGAQIEDIVKAAGVARGTFYIHFPTKDHVLLEYLDRLQTSVTERLADLSEGAPRPFFRDAVDLLVEVVRNEDSTILREALSIVSRHVAELESGAPLYTGMTAFFEAAQERGDIRSDLLPSELAAAFLPGVFGVLLLGLGGTESELRKALLNTVDVFVRGISP